MEIEKFEPTFITEIKCSYYKEIKEPKIRDHWEQVPNSFLYQNLIKCEWYSTLINNLDSQMEGLPFLQNTGEEDEIWIGKQL